MAGGMCVVRAGRVLARLPLPIGGILSDLRAPDVAAQQKDFSHAWSELGCTLTYEAFNRLTSHGQTEIRLTFEGINLLPGVVCVPLFETKINATTS
jgi:adenine deaminase